jgi:hypothetical protein
VLIFTDNLLDIDPHLKDVAHGSSPAFKLGFQRIPLDKIGLGLIHYDSARAQGHAPKAMVAFGSRRGA